MSKTHSEAQALTGTQWRERLGELCDTAMEAQASQAGDHLRAGYGLLRLAPGRDNAMMQALPAPETFEAMLGCAALESAALSLLPRGSSYLLSRGSDDFCLASVVLPFTTEEVTAEGASPALALLSALCAALVAPAGGAKGRGLSDIARLMLPEAHLLN